MAAGITADICVIGAGSGGLTVAAGAAQLGASVVLVERRLMGGDCLNYGCVPSKALIAASRAAAAVREAGRFGVRSKDPEIDPAAVFDHVRRTIAAIAPNDSVERFEGLGVRVVRDHARFTGPDEIAAGELRVRARRFVIATGSEPVIPDVPGLASVPHLTNETVFSLDALPRRLIVLGGGPVGIELAQAFRRLGSEVAVIDRGSILPRDDPELVAVVRRRLESEGIVLCEHAELSLITAAGDGLAAILAGRSLSGTHLLVAAGRRPVTDGLDLDKAGVEFGPAGIAVDARLRTSNRRIYAVGDVVGGPMFTHAAGHHAAVVLKNALFRVPAKVDGAALPRVTYCDPELAQVGLSERDCRDRGLKFRILRWGFAENDRARTEADIDGLTKALVAPNGRILGAGIVGAHAGETLHGWLVAMAGGVRIGRLAQMISPYPTRGEIIKRAAGSFYAPKLFGARTRRLVRLLMKLP